MKIRLRGRTAVLLVGSVIAFQMALSAQTSQTTSGVKRPLTYDVVDYWKSIGGTRLSDDGQWLAYSVTSQAEDGELIVRNLRSGQEYRHPRGTGPQITSDGKFVIFTIAQSKADEEKERLANRGRGEGAAGETTPSTTPAEPAAAPTGGRQGGAAGRGNQQRRQEPRTGLGIMSLADGKVTTVDKVGSFRLPEGNATWLAYYKGTGGGGAARRRAAGGADAAAAGHRRQQPAPARGKGVAVRRPRAIASSRDPIWSCAT